MDSEGRQSNPVILGRITEYGGRMSIKAATGMLFESP
jgi:hypothetical protein